MHIAMYAATLRHWGKLDPRALNEDVPSPAGTEIAMMGVARGLAHLGHRVSVYANTEGGTHDGVDYIPADFALPLLTTVEHDVVVSWQEAGIFMYPLKTKLRVLMSQSAHLGVGQAADKIDRYFAISRFSAQTLLDSDPYADPAKMWVTRNGVDLSRFNGSRDATGKHPPVRNPHRMVWLSSPDRGLHHLVDIFPRVRALVPDAELVVLYNFDKTLESYKQTMPGSAFVRWLEECQSLKAMPGVQVLNHVSQPQVADILLSSGVVAYPCDPIRPTETYCIALTEAMAAGCAVICSDADCLPENYMGAALFHPRPINHVDWAHDIARLMTNEDDRRMAVAAGRKLAALCDFTDIASEWGAFFEEYLRGGSATVDRSLAAQLGR